MPKLLVIIPNFSRSETDVGMLRRCLVALRRVEPNVAVMVWDDCSPYKDTRSLIKTARDHDASLVLSPLKCPSYSDVINLAVSWGRERGYDQFCTLNSDVETVTSFMDTAQGIWEDGLADVFGGTLLYPTGRIQSAGFTVRENGQPYEYSKSIPYLSDVDSKRAQFVPGVTGAMQFFHAGCGAYPTGYRFGFEDIHFCLSQWQHGRSVLYVPSIEAVHSESVTRGKFPKQSDLDTIAHWHMARQAFDVPWIEARARHRTQEYLSPTQAELSRLPLTDLQGDGVAETASYRGR